uniref:(California timema) hypothetical protein n=1 Tax=Timema californicum TaxID=61474 RepID=A0A7R9P303_TIMCA|nr:unnamed protein product [Timema californicum]
MANIAAQRIKREFKEVIKSEEDRRGTWEQARCNMGVDSWYHDTKPVAKCAIKVELLNDNYTELKGEIAGPPETPYEGGTFILEIKVPETYPFNPPKALLAAAEPDDPQDAVVAKQFKESLDMFRQTAKHWTAIYAGG